jgi:hypothetical protein
MNSSRLVASWSSCSCIPEVSEPTYLRLTVSIKELPADDKSSLVSTSLVFVFLYAGHSSGGSGEGSRAEKRPGFRVLSPCKEEEEEELLRAG